MFLLWQVCLGRSKHILCMGITALSTNFLDVVMTTLLEKKMYQEYGVRCVEAGARVLS
jgi:hypothetical protein